MCRDWLEEYGEAFRAGDEVTTLGPFHDYKSAISDQPDDVTIVLDQAYVAQRYVQQLRSAYHALSTTEDRHIIEKVPTSFPTCPIPEIR